jgi:hypothetical protein
VVHENGDIERTDMYLNPSGSWTLEGIQKINSKQPIVPREEITREWLAANDVRKYAVVDLDHGTTRRWGDTMADIWVYEKAEETAYYRHTRERLKRLEYRP